MIKQTTRNQWVLFIGACCLVFGMRFYVRHVLVPMQMADAVAHQRPRGNLSDLYPRWLGARELLLHRRDPYSPEITKKIQIGYYGRILDASRPNDPKDQEGFVYPVYVVFLLAPLIAFPFSSVQSGFLWFLIFIVMASVVCWFKALRWQPQNLTVLTAIAFAFGNFPTLQALALRQLSVLVAGIFSLVCFFVVRRKFVFAGMMLALATIKPQLAAPLAAWLCLWSLCNWTERRNFLLSFLGGILVLFSTSEFILPGWLGKFYHAVTAYQQYTGGLTPSDVLFGRTLGKIITILLIIVGAIISFRSRHADESSAQFAFASCFILATTVAIVPIFAPYNQLLLFPGILFLIQYRRLLNPQKIWQRILLSIVILGICWQWIAVAVLTLIYCFVSTSVASKMWEVPFYLSIPLPMIIMCLLYVCAAKSDQVHMQQALVSAHTSPLK